MELKIFIKYFKFLNVFLNIKKKLLEYIKISYYLIYLLYNKL